MTNTMRALVYERYGAPEDVLELREVPVPVPGPQQVLVKVHVCAFNPLDWHMMTGKPRIARLSFGPLRPRRNTPGNDFAGVVEAVGEEVTRFRPGAEVLGESGVGAMAEFVAVPEEALVDKPATVTFEEAAAAPIAGLTALQALRDWGGMDTGNDVLIVGASGGVGTYAIQIARALGANHITAVCSTGNVEMARSLGADQVIDYTREDYTEHGRQYDVILDGPGNRPLRRNRRLLAPGGTYVLVGGRKGDWVTPFPTIVKNLLANLVGYANTRKGFAERTEQDLTMLRDWLESGVIRSVIDRNYKLEEGPEALTYQGTFHARGKIVVTI